MSLHPPPRFAVSGDLDFWLKRFEMYAKQAGIPDDQLVKELFSLLEDEPFRVVSRQGVESSMDYVAVCDCLCQHFAPAGSEIEWQFKLQVRVQKPGESLWEFAVALRAITKHIHDGQTSNVQSCCGINLYKECGHHLFNFGWWRICALKTASQQETVKTAHKCLLQECQRLEAAALTEDPATEHLQSAAVTSTASGVRPTLQRDKMIDALSKQVKNCWSSWTVFRLGKDGNKPRQENSPAGSVVEGDSWKETVLGSAELGTVVQST